MGSLNPTKIEAVRTVFESVFADHEIEIIGKSVPSNVSEQPFDDDVIKGAIERAKGALEDADFGVGIEAGLISNVMLGTHFDVQYCAIVDRTGKTTIGHGSGFMYPESIMKEVARGKTIGEAMIRLTGIEDIGTSIGAIGYLTKKTLNRTELSQQAVLMALIPRIHSDLYE